MIPNGLFGRNVYVDIVPPVGLAIRVPDLRVSFKVELKSSKTVNKASIRIYNPSPATIALLHIPKTSLRLMVGYGTFPRLLFIGTPIKDGIDLKVEGPDRILDIDAADGGAGYVGTFLNVSFSTPTTFGQVLATVLAATQWSQGFVDPAISAVVLPYGIVLVGRPSEVLDRLAAASLPVGADWYVRDGAVYVVPKGTATPEVAPLISSTQGNLIGSPNYTKKGIKVKALIDATMRPGRLFIVESAGWGGPFIAKDVTFNGDSGWDNQFYMEITAKPAGVP